MTVNLAPIHQALASLFLLLLVACDQNHTEPALPVPTTILDARVEAINYQLWNLTLGGSGRIYGSRGKELHRITTTGEQTELLYTFDADITGIHQRQDGLILVATDQGRWDIEQPCLIYISTDNGQHFTHSKTFPHSVALWWSISSDAAGRIFIGEYGPQQKGLSTRVWRSLDNGQSWQVVFSAQDKDNVHIHRVAVDPYTQDVWITAGDGRNRQMWRSRDHGQSWHKMARLQATAVSFTKNTIFWGRDKKKATGIMAFNRQTERFSTAFKPQTRGNFGGSLYDMAEGEDGALYAPFKKYPDQPHAASLWRGKDHEWHPIMWLESKHKQTTDIAFDTIAGPDQHGWLYVTGYRINSRAHTE